MAENEAHESIKPFHVFSTDQESASVNSYQNNSDKKKKSELISVRHVLSIMNFNFSCAILEIISK